MNSQPDDHYLKQDSLQALPAGAVQLTGLWNDRILLGIEKQIKALDYEKLVDFFRHRSNPFAAGEFWGKTVRAACEFYAYTRDPRLEGLLAATVTDLLSTQSSDGCISTRTYEEQPKSSDLWERKYVLLALLGWWQHSKDPTVLSAMKRMTDYTLGQIGSPPKTRIVDTGWAFHGIESSSILEPIVRLYQITGEDRYLDFARYIVEEEGACKRVHVFESALAGIAPKDIGTNGNPSQSVAKAYECMSCFEGLAEYSRIMHEERWRDATLRYYRGILEREITLIGSGAGEGPYNQEPGRGELWNDIAFDQCNLDPRLMMETCVTVTWIKFCLQVLRLTGDSTVVDQIECSLYNALAGAQRPSGDYYDYFQNFNGVRNTPVNFSHLIGQFPLSCCTANGPMGMALIPSIAIMRSSTGVAINLFMPSTATIVLDDALSVELSVSSQYPKDGVVRIEVRPSRVATFGVSVRIPAWSSQTTLTVNGESHSATPGTYRIIERFWSPGDRIELSLDLRCRLKLASPAQRPELQYQALMRGPNVLARDARLEDDPDHAVAFKRAEGDYIELEPGELHPFAELSFRAATPSGDSIPVIDYASAGNSWDERSRFATWTLNSSH